MNDNTFIGGVGMKYKDLISFEPIESVIKLVDSNKKSTARQLVKDYVISDEMAERLTSLVIPELQFEEPGDNKGIFIVGNYGTGKSHLMSVISSIAEDETLLEDLSNKEVSDSAKNIAGKFIVIRCEIGASEMSLRDIIIGELEEHLRELDIDFSFPAANAIPNHIHSFEEMMSLFHQKYPKVCYLSLMNFLTICEPEKTRLLFWISIFCVRLVNLQSHFVSGLLPDCRRQYLTTTGLLLLQIV